MVPVVTAASLVVGTVRVAVNHQFQHSLFNAIGIPMASQFDRDYYRMSAKQGLEYILALKPEGKVTIKSNYSLNTPKMGLPTADAERITLRGGERPAEYYIEMFRDYAGNEPQVPGYTEIHAIWVDGYKIASILINDVLYDYQQTGVMEVPASYFFSNNENVYAPQFADVRASKGVEGYMLFGPYFALDAGSHTLDIDLDLKAYMHSNPNIGAIDIAGKSGSEVYAAQPFTAADFDAEGRLHITLPFTLPDQVYDLEIRVYNFRGVWLDAESPVTVTKTAG